MRAASRMGGVLMIAACLLICGCSAVPQALSAPPKLAPAAAEVQKTSLASAKASVSEMSMYQETSDIPDLVGGSEREHRVYHEPPQTAPETIPQATGTTHLFYSGSRAQKEVALTFDDGPDVHTTSEILAVLKKYNVKATFFIIGTRALAHPEMVQQIAKDGHAIGNHSWDHPNLAQLSPAQVKSEVERADNQLYAILGYHPALFRPPYGSTTPAVLKELSDLHYSVVDWSVDTVDWAGTPTPQILANVRKEIYPGGIILEHCAGGKNDNLSNTVAALPQIIVSLRAQGYTFVTVPELLHVPAKIS